MSRVGAFVTLASVAVAGLALASTGHAEGTVWGRARTPDAARRAELVAEADSLILRHGRYQSTFSAGDSSTDPMLREALRKLDEAGGLKSNDVYVLARYGSVLDHLNDSSGCVRALEAAVKLRAPAPVLASAYTTLAICHAKLGHQTEEIRGYDLALSLQSETGGRSVLLSNRAEALMAIGDVSGAMSGYREALTLLPQSATTYWGLGVALDRSGNLDGALESIRIGRTYDRTDRRISDRSNWFFSPAWDEPWYFALGHWQSARESTTAAARTEHYLAAVAHWEEYIQRAPAEDRYVPLARVRLKECEKERDRARKRAPEAAPPKKGDGSHVSPVPARKLPVPRGAPF